jgi:Sporulation delaying protein SdpA
LRGLRLTARMRPRKPPAPADAFRSGFAFTLGFLLLLMAGSALAQLRSPGPLEVLWPQHWSFFADEPDREAWIPYRISSGGEPTSLAIRHGSGQTWGGLGRKSHAQLAETAYLAGQVSEHQWHRCSGLKLLDCGRAAMNSRPVAVNNPAPLPTICGDVLLSVERPSRGRSLDGAGLDPTMVVVTVVRCGGR